MKEFYLSILILFTLPLVLAAPGPPHQLYGSVNIAGVSAPDGTAVQAKVAEDVYTTFTSGGKFGFNPHVFLVEDPDGNRDQRSVIEVFVNYKKIQEIRFSGGGYTELNLILENECGDGFCLGGDTCSSCSGDCGACPSSNTGTDGTGGGTGGGGGGAGGFSTSHGITTQTCIEQWECSEWGECKDGKQKRLCRDNGFCKTEKLKPLEEKECIEDQNFGAQGELEDTQKEIQPSLLGAVLGNVGSVGGIAFIFILLVIIAALVILVVRKRTSD